MQLSYRHTGTVAFDVKFVQNHIKLQEYLERATSENNHLSSDDAAEIFSDVITTVTCLLQEWEFVL
jgi:hypothetical protein